jgi:hypothetical protein
MEMPIAEAMAPVMATVAILTTILVIAVGSMLLRSRAQERLHRERMFLAEKGLPIPAELYVQKKNGNGDLRSARAWLLVLGVLMVFIGTAVMITIGVTDSEGIRGSVRGLPPVAIGLGLLIAERVLVKRLLQPRPKA